MKIIIFAFIICVSRLTNAAISTELRKAIWGDGADTKVIFKVVDDQGLPLCGADVKASFWLECDGRSHSVQGLTNEEGLFSAGRINRSLLFKDIWRVCCWETRRCNL